MQLHSSTSSTSTRWETLKIMPRVSRRAASLADVVADPLEPGAPGGGPLGAGPADQGPLLGDLEPAHADCSFALPAVAATAAAAFCLATVTGDISASSRPRRSAT